MKKSSLLYIFCMFLIASLTLCFTACGIDTEGHSDSTEVSNSTDIEIENESGSIESASESVSVTASDSENETESNTLTETFTETYSETELISESITESLTESYTSENGDTLTESETPTDSESMSAEQTFTETESTSETESALETESLTESETVTETETEEIDTCNHAYRYKCSTECRYCGKKRKNTTAHRLTYECSEKCSLCRETVDEPKPHSLPFACSDTCTVCRAEITDVNSPHSYPFACSDTCTVCEKVREPLSDHAFNSNLTCVDLTCGVCGLVLEQDHNWEIISDTTSFFSAGTVVEECSRCNECITTNYDQPIDPASIGMPVIYINDLDNAAIPLTNLKKANGEITVEYEYVSNSDTVPSFKGFSSIKVQGASSSGHPKKNYTIKLYEDEGLLNKLKVDLGWGRENKYCMKANYVDFSQARNIIGAQIFAQLVSSRDNINEGLLSSPNYGVIDGYPVIVMVNGEFHGLYTMNIPKDDWMFGMEGEEESREALLMADAWTNSVNMREQIGEGTFADYGWEVEHCSTADETWIKESFNELIALLNCGDNARIKAELANHLDIEAAIDNMIYTYFINAADNVAKNILWATYDGKIWIPSMYDMDGTFGIYYNGTPIPVDSNSHDGAPRNTFPSINQNGTLYVPGMKVYSVLINCFADEVEARYRELRKEILTVENTRAHFEAFYAKAPMVAYRSDNEKWTATPGADTNLTNMYEATEKQLQRLDDFFYNFNK